jgi:hypothetical protein
MRFAFLPSGLGVGGCAGIGVAVVLALSACTEPTTRAPTETVCPDPDPMTLTWDNFGQSFMATYCTLCHSSTLARAQRNGAPVFHDYDTLDGVLRIPDHVDEVAGAGPASHNNAMPPSECPSMPGGSLDRDCKKPSEAERTNLAQWIACERNRPH